MSMPNPQHEQILRIISQVPMPPYRLHNVYDATRYVIEGDKEVDCLGVYDNECAVLFGEWQGVEDQRPRVSVERIAKCIHAFLVRSATDEEMRASGSRKVLVYLEVPTEGMYGTRRVNKVVFRSTEHIGFYNPIV